MVLPAAGWMVSSEPLRARVFDVRTAGPVVRFFEACVREGRRVAMMLWVVCLVCLVDPVGLVQPNKRDKPNKPSNGLLALADFFSMLLQSFVGGDGRCQRQHQILWFLKIV